MNKLLPLLAISLLNVGCVSIPEPSYPGELVWSRAYGGEAICVAKDNNVLCTSDRANKWYTSQILENRRINGVTGPACYYFIDGNWDEEAGCRNHIQYHNSYPTGLFMHDVTGFRKHQMIDLLDGTNRLYRTIILRDRRGNPVQ